jgi:hypothetical protein
LTKTLVFVRFYSFLSEETMKEAIEALFGNKGVATPEHVEVLKGIRSLDDVNAEGIDPDAMDRLGYFLDAPSETAQSETDDDRRPLLLALVGHLVPKKEEEKKKEEKPADRPALGGGEGEEKPSSRTKDPRKDLLAAFDKVEIGGEEEEEEGEVMDEQPRTDNRQSRRGDDRTRERRSARDREYDRDDRDTRQSRRDRKKDEPQPPKPAMIIGKEDHLLARIHVDPCWVELRDHIFGEIKTMRENPSKARVIRWQLNQLVEALNDGPVMAERFPHNVRLLAMSMITDLLLDLDTKKETKEMFAIRYGAAPTD